MHIGVVYYYVSDINRALAFYRDKLGLKPKMVKLDAPNPWAEFDTGGTTKKEGERVEYESFITRRWRRWQIGQLN